MVMSDRPWAGNKCEWLEEGLTRAVNQTRPRHFLTFLLVLLVINLAWLIDQDSHVGDS